MSFTINTNVASLEAQSYLGQTSAFQQQTIAEVTSGLRIVNSGNDAAGLAVANGYASDEAVLTQGIANANNGIGQLQTVDGGENNISQLLNRASTLATQSASGTFTGSRTTLNNEFQSVLTEINREAQAIGLNQGGALATNLSLYVGGGAGATTASAALDGQEQLNLSTATVDAKSLGLVGVQVVGGTAGTTDIGDGAATTTVANIVTNTTNTGTEAVSGYTNFFINGPGFSSTSGGTQIKLAVNLTGVTDTDTLVTAINAAITAAGGAGSQQATAFANANITASTNIDSSGKTQLTFNSSSSAFQVTAGDKVSNALLGNFGSGAVGKTADATVTGSVALAGSSAAETPIVLSFQGLGLSSAQTASVTVAAASNQATVLAAVNTAIAANATLAATGITASLSGGTTGSLVFTAPASQSFTVQANGDVANELGLGSYGASGATVTGAVAVTSSQTQNLQISVNGGASVTLTGVVSGLTGTTAAAAINTAIQSLPGAATLRAAGITASTTVGTAAAAATIGIGGANGVTFTANTANAAGDNINVTFVAAAGASAATTVGVSGNAITVTLGTGTTAGVVNANATQVIAAIAASSAAALVTATATGVATTVQAIASATNLAGGADGTTKVVLTSGTGVDFAVNSVGALNAFGLNSSTQTGVATALPTQQSGFAAGGSPQLDAQGENQSNTSVTGTDAFTFTGLTNAGDAQTVTLSAIDATGNAHNINVALTTSNAGTLDQTLATINTALQTSNDTTLQSLVAFKQQTGTTNTVEGIRFASSAATFTASLGATTNGVGLSDGSVAQGATNLLGSAVYGTAGTANISNASSAAAAVTALANSVSILGNAQAVVGRGENQFQYAANLAQSQLTNDQAAEAQIRDANIAEESANLTKASIQLQAGVAALAQANSAPQQLLTLLQGH